MGDRKQPLYADATFYAQVEPKWGNTGAYWTDRAGNPILEGAKVATITQQRPEKPRRGVVVVKLTVRVPASAFLPLSPEAVVVVPEGMTETIMVEAADPTDGICRPCADAHPDESCDERGCTHDCEQEVSRG